ncbi:zinc finger BED domain-containing protein DAYSLEEPER-like [Setaria italica]|uniref:zinc finger BED domain-containing protein DAYSLEEPER-like n=1 Tax=Setaria italica TaxID=4555 RepID=UPI000BE50319|nr:zinc finger BED domain-containing protein DAYSLEEPER-like [Setaria italica]
MDENYTINDDLRACGLPCDDEDDVAAGAVPLVGSSSAPVNVDAAGAGGTIPPSTPSSTPSSTPTTSTGTSVRKGKRRSTAWNDFEELFQEGANGKKSHLQFHSDGSIINWEYKPDLARKELCRLIARLDLPLGFGETEAFVEYIQRAHNPRFAKVSRQTTSRDLAKFFAERRLSLVDTLKSHVSSVCLTSDIWSGNAKEDYLSVVAHFVSADWELEKRVIALRLIDCSHSGVNIAERIEQVVSEFGLQDKIFSITLDNASANTSAMSTLIPKFVGYLGPDPEPLDSDSDSDKALLSITSAFSRGYAPRKFGLDMDPLLTENHWVIAEKILLFLEMFYDSTVALSGVYYPTSPLMLHHIIEIAGHLHGQDSDPLLRNIAVPMKLKFLKAKVRGFHNVLQLLSQTVGVDYSSYFTEVRTQLHKLFNKYENKFGAVRSQRPAQPSAATGKKRTTWGKIFGGPGTCGSPVLSSTPPISPASELSSYLDSDTISCYDDDFNILSWWHEHKLSYPILSILAKDVMSVPVSTVSSESCFSLTGKVIEERRRRLLPETVEMLTCLKDWELGDARAQHDVEKEVNELEETYKSPYPDMDEGQATPSQ